MGEGAIDAICKNYRNWNFCKNTTEGPNCDLAGHGIKNHGHSGKQTCKKPWKQASSET